jgi:hypothetical protein
MRRTAVWLVCSLWALSCLPAHAIVLRYSPKEGLVTKHKMTMTGATTMTMPEMEGPAMNMKMAMSGSVLTTEKVLSTSEESATVETRITGGKINMTAQGQTNSVDIPEGRIVAEMDRHGRMVKIIESDMDTSTEQMLTGGLDYNDFAEFGAAFPDDDLKVKDTWTGEMKLPLGEGLDITLTATSRLLELGVFQGRKCAKIRSTFKGPLTLDMSAMGMSEEGGESSATGSLNGLFVSYYDYENSVYVSAEGTITVAMEMTSSDPQGGAFTSNMKSTTTIKSKLVK